MNTEWFKKLSRLGKKAEGVAQLVKRSLSAPEVYSLNPISNNIDQFTTKFDLEKKSLGMAYLKKCFHDYQ